MKKAIFVIITLMFFCCAIAGCSAADTLSVNSGGINYLPLFDENGIYSEDNFVYNAALEKDGAHLIIEGETHFGLRYKEDADETVFAAVNMLKYYFDSVGSGIEIKTDDGVLAEKTIYVGNFNEYYTPQVTLQKAGAYIVDIDQSNIFIYADTVYGTTNGVYGFMEDYLGCMFFDRDATYIPPVTTVILESVTDAQEPAFEARDIGDSEVNGSLEFRQRLRVRKDESYNLDDCHHSLNMIAKDILAAHPEYYAELGGQRRTSDYMFQKPQLCFSNDEVIDLLEEAIVKKEANKKTSQTVWWDISQQDSMNYCTCEKCAALTEETGNPASPIFRCVNIIAKRHPELKISTLAYQYGSAPPTNIEFEPNVLIKWCLMSSYGANDFSAPISEEMSEVASQQYQEIVGWAELTDNLFVWDYTTNFFFYQLPFPNWNAMEGNLRLLRDCNVSGIYTCTSYNARSFCDRLKANLDAHLLWNPDIDAKEFMSKFLTLYLGKDAAPYILAMYERMADEVESELWVYDMPMLHKDDYLSEENVNEYFRLLNEAFSAAEGNETYLKRLRYEIISLLYTAIRLSYGDKKENKREFVELCEEFGISSLNEVGTEKVSQYK